MTLKELLRDSLDTGTLHKGIPEAQVERLREALPRFVGVNPYAPGDLVTPRLDTSFTGKGDPHLVFEIGEFSGGMHAAFSHGAAMRFDTRVICIGSSGSIMPYEMPSWALEPWTPEHAAREDSR